MAETVSIRGNLEMSIPALKSGIVKFLYCCTNVSSILENYMCKSMVLLRIFDSLPIIYSSGVHCVE